MNFGLMYDFRNPPQWRRPFPELYQRILDQMIAAEELGYSSVWLSEHHFVEDGYCPSLMAVAAAIAARTSRIRIGTSVLLLPLNHPLRVAEDAAVVDIISKGRLILGLGRGYRLEEFQGYGVSRTAKGSIFEEGLDIIRRAWAEETFSYEGEHYRVRDVNVYPKPVQRPHPPIMLGAQSDNAARMVARLGYRIILIGGKRQYDIYAQALREHGRDPDEFRLTVSHGVYASEDPEKAALELKDHLQYRMDSYQRWRITGGTRRERETGQPQSPSRPPLFIGEPGACIREIEDLQSHVPIDTLIFPATLPGQDPDNALEHLEFFAKKVMPHFADGA